MTKADPVRAIDSVGGGDASCISRFHLLSRATGDIVWEWDLVTGLLSLGGAADRFGLADGPAMRNAQDFFARLHPDDGERVAGSVAAALAGIADRWSDEYRLRCGDGQFRWFWDRALIVRGCDGRPLFMLGCMSEVSERREAVELLRDSERRLSALVEATSSMIMRFGCDGEVLAGAEQWQAYTGGEGASLQALTAAIHPEDRPAVRAAHDDVGRSGKRYSIEFRLRRHDGEYRTFAATGVPVFRDDLVVEWVVLLVDVHERREAEDRSRLLTGQLAERVKELRVLHSVAVGCNQEAKSLEAVLHNIAFVLPSGLARPDLAVCELSVGASAVRSRDYGVPLVRLREPLRSRGERVGFVEIGYLCEDLPFSPEERQLVVTVASLISQMLGRRADRLDIERQRQDLWRRTTMLEQTEALARVGGWEYDVATGRMDWSDQLYAIAGLDDRRPVTLEEHIGFYAGEAAQTVRAALDALVADGLPFDLEVPWRDRQGRQRWVRTLGQAQISDGRVERAFGITKDVTEEREARDRAWDLANHDSLTSLPNRRLFHDHLDGVVREAVETEGLAGLLLVDLDHFKDVNDTLGHDAGDQLLRHVGERIIAAVGPDGIVARIGGDEFAVLLPGLRSRDAATHIACAISAALREELYLDTHPASSRATIGIAFAPADAATAADLLKAADIALYAGKAKGRDEVAVFTEAMREKLRARIRTCAEVRSSLLENRFIPYYQPQVGLTDGRVFGFEALMRWRHPEDGLLSPIALAAAFEDTELAIGLGECMLNGVIADMQAWRRSGLDVGHIALNISSAEFRRPDLAANILSRLAAADIPPDTFVVEVTETVLLGREADNVAETLKQLSRAGVRVALDDFGTGYASLTHLKQFPVDIIKIDRSFIESIEADAEKEAIVSVIADLGRRLGKKVVAEGVETELHASIAARSGCDCAQGFLFARPAPASRVRSILRASELARWSAEAARRCARTAA